MAYSVEQRLAGWTLAWHWDLRSCLFRSGQGVGSEQPLGLPERHLDQAHGGPVLYAVGCQA